MRCKNCGSENDDNLYICQNCGSPLYDEEETASYEEHTKMFTPPVVGSGYNNDEHIPAKNGPMPSEKDDNKKQIIIIAVLAVVLVALIAGLVFGVLRNKTDNTNTTSSTQVTDDDGSIIVTEDDEDEETTKESTTEKTTEKTTTTTEAKKQYTITVGTNDSGWAEGGGTFKEGDSVTVYCGADDGFEFDGWYKDGKKVSGSEKYTFKANDDVYLEARFYEEETTKQPEEAEEATTASADGIDTDDGGDVG